MVEMKNDLDYEYDPLDYDLDEFEDPNIHLPITEQLARFREECEKDKEAEIEFYRLNPNRV